MGQKRVRTRGERRSNTRGAPRKILLTSFCPVVTSTALTKDKVVRAEKVTKRTGADGVHGSGLEINQDRTRDILVRADLVVVYRDTLQLQVVGAFVETILVDAVLVGNNLPELGTFLSWYEYTMTLRVPARHTNLVTALLTERDE